MLSIKANDVHSLSLNSSIPRQIPSPNAYTLPINMHKNIQNTPICINRKLKIIQCPSTAEWKSNFKKEKVNDARLTERTWIALQSEWMSRNHMQHEQWIIETKCAIKEVTWKRIFCLSHLYQIQKPTKLDYALKVKMADTHNQQWLERELVSFMGS